MKKVFAILLVLMMSLSCLGAVAEGKFGITPPMTRVQYYEVNEEAVMNLFKQAGLPEDVQPTVSAILALLNNVGIKEVTTENGSQWELMLKETSVANLVMAAEDGNISLATSLLPSYTLTISLQTITDLLEQVMETVMEAALNALDQYQDVLAKAFDAFSGVNFDALEKNYAEYAKEFMTEFLSAYTMGEAEAAEYTLAEKNIVFNQKRSFDVDISAMVNAAADLVNNRLKDENALALVAALNSMGLNVKLPAEVSAEELNAEKVPQVKGAVYSIVDENGKPVSDTKAVVVESYENGAEEAAVKAMIYVSDKDCIVTIEKPAKKDAVRFSIDASVENLANLKYTHTVGDLYLAVDSDVVYSESGIVVISSVYLMDQETPVLIECDTVTPGGELTVPLFSEEKTVLSAEEMMQDEDGKAIALLTMDLMFNGLSGLIENIGNSMPEAASALLTVGAPKTAE